jgi:hypothetical protein
LGDNSFAFIENRGQFDPRVKFQLKSASKTVWLTSSGIVFDVLRPKEGFSAGKDAQRDRHAPQPADQPEFERLAFAEDFTGANKDPKIEPLNLRPARRRA